MNNNGRRRPEAKVEELAAKKVEATARERGTDSPKPGVPLDFSVEVNELLTRAESDPASAMDLLKILARDLRARKLPNRMLADYIAGAIEEASAAGPKADHQARVLTGKLHLTRHNRRPAGSWLEIGPAMHMLVSKGFSQTRARLEVAVEYDVDEGTVLKYYKKYLAAKQEHDGIK